MGTWSGRTRSLLKIFFWLGAAVLLCTRCSAVFTCDGGATVLAAHEVNNDYCDCADGADETLTPACSHAARSRFTCAESGPLNQTIPTSRVWDGVCDCCGGSDEISREEGLIVPSSRGRGSEREARGGCENECQRLIEEARAEAIEVHRRAEAGLRRRREAEGEGRRAVARWKATLRVPGTDAEEEETQRAERKAVEKLEALLKVYLQHEERLERREKMQLAAAAEDEKQTRTRDVPVECKGARYRHGAAALGPVCFEGGKEEMEAAEKVRVMRAAAMARLDEEEEEKKVEEEKNGRKRGGRKNADQSRKQNRRGEKGDKGGRVNRPDTAEDVLDLRWPLTNALSDAEAASSGGQEEKEGSGGAGEPEDDRAAKEEDGAILSLRSYVKRRQQGGAREPLTEEKKAEELRKTALLGPVLNDGERGLYLGLTILLRVVGLPLFSPVRGLVEACVFLGSLVTAAVVEAASKLGAPLAVIAALEGYRDRGLAGISPRLDYRRYPTLRWLVTSWDMFLSPEGSGRFLMVMWDAPVALWGLLFPELDVEHQRPEAAMLREGIARAKESLRQRGEERNGIAQAAGKRGKGGRRKREETEARRLLDLDLGKDSGFAALAEKCLDLQQGGYVYSLCPFKEAKQDKHSLGKWKGWAPRRNRRDHDYRAMLFDGGSRCHNKKQRSAEVLVECGPHDALVAAEELEIGVYRLAMETPLACTEGNVREAEQRLEVFQGEESGGIADTPGNDRHEL